MTAAFRKDGWKIALLGDYAKISSGATPNRKKPEFWNGDIPWITTSKICYRRIVEADEKITEEGLASSSTRVYSKGTLLLAMYGQGATRGRVGVLGIPAAINQACAALEPTNGLKSDYLYHYLVYHYQDLRNLSQGGNQANLSGELIRSLRVIIPSEREQERIAFILTMWDRAIDLSEQLIADKGMRRKGLMQQLLTGKRRLPGFKKSTEVLRTRWGYYPADWGYPRIGEIAKHVSIKNLGGASLPVLSCTKHRGLVDSMEYFGKQVFSKDLSTYKLVRRCQFAYATNHIEEGSIGYQNLHDVALISPMYTVFEAGKNIDDRFLFLLLKMELYRHIFEVNTSASVDRRGSLRWPEFSRLHVPLPSLEEQQAIVKVVDIADRELDLLQAKAQALREQKKGLMQQLLTGKKRLKIERH